MKKQICYVALCCCFCLGLLLGLIISNYRFHCMLEELRLESEPTVIKVDSTDDFPPWVQRSLEQGITEGKTWKVIRR